MNLQPGYRERTGACLASAATRPADDAPRPNGTEPGLPADGARTRADRDAPTRSASGNLGTVGLLILAVGTFTLGVDGFVLSGLLPQVSADLDVSPGTAGQLTTLFAIAYAVG